DPGVDHLFDAAYLLGTETVPVCEVEAKPLGRDKRARLGNVVAEHVAKRCMQQVSGAVVLLGLTPARVDERPQALTALESAAHDPHLVQDQPVAGPFRPGDHGCSAGPLQLAYVAYLAAAFGVEGRSVEDDDTALGLGESLLGDTVSGDRGHQRLAGNRLEADELRLAGGLGQVSV